MCFDNGLNRVLHCTVAELKAGSRYRTPEGEEFIVTEVPGVVNLRTGSVHPIPDNLGLGHDRRGRLYASRFLNPPQA